MENGKNEEKGEFQSSEILLEIARSEYQNEFNRTSVIDTKIGIALPIIATYFFLVLQHESIREIFVIQPNTQNIVTILFSVFSPWIYVRAIACAGIALIQLFRAITTHTYQKLDPKCFNDKEKMSLSKNEFSAVMVTYYVQALEHNHQINNTRVALYQVGLALALISLVLFVYYIFLTT